MSCVYNKYVILSSKTKFIESLLCDCLSRRSDPVSSSMLFTNYVIISHNFLYYHFRYCLTNLYSNNEYVAQLAAKRYQRYLKEEEKKRYPKWIQDIITAILMLIKLTTNALEKASIKKKRVIEKISVE